MENKFPYKTTNGQLTQFELDAINAKPEEFNTIDPQNITNKDIRQLWNERTDLRHNDNTPDSIVDSEEASIAKAIQRTFDKTPDSCITQEDYLLREWSRRILSYEPRDTLRDAL